MLKKQARSRKECSGYFFSLFSYFGSSYLELILIISCQCQETEYRKMKQLFMISLCGYLKPAPSLLEICSSSAGIWAEKLNIFIFFSLRCQQNPCHWIVVNATPGLGQQDTVLIALNVEGALGSALLSVRATSRGRQGAGQWTEVLSTGLWL